MKKHQLLFTIIFTFSILATGGTSSRQQKTAQNDHIRPDPLIVQMLSTVDPDSCARTLRDLCGFYNRYARDKYNIEEVVPYLEQKFRDYKCDSVYRLPVSGMDAPAVVGVRWGTVNPTMKKVCLIGAHPDTYCNEGGRHQGAYDNGCGNVGYLEAARVMQHFTFENTILFAAFNAEEVGMLGSKKIVDELLDEGTEILGGAVTYDMLGIAPSSSGKISHAICTSVPGGQAFADKMEELADEYNLKVNVTTQTSTDIPTDTKHFWKNDYSGSCGRGGRGAGTYHTKADSISDIFDSTWLAEAVSPGIAAIAYYAVPEAVNSISGTTTPLSRPTVAVHTATNGAIHISISSLSCLPERRVTVYSLSGRKVAVLFLKEETENRYTTTWNKGTGSCTGTGLYILSGKAGNSRFHKKLIIKK
jgi:hypothetical protein